MRRLTVSEGYVSKEKPGETVRVVRKVVITYRLAEDREETERTLTLEHGGRGEEMDGVVWSEQLIRRIAYLERDGSCTEAKKARGTGEWKVYSSATKESASGGDGDCFWLHDPACSWWEYCSEF
jgi:hypothetical protein